MAPVAVPITAIYASLLALWLLFLANRVATFRRVRKVGIGGDPTGEIGVLIRAHANAVENVPITLLLLLLAELNGAPASALHVAGVTLVVARLAHTQGFMQTKGLYSHGRFFGTGANWLLNVLLVAGNLYLAFVPPQA